MRHDAEGEYVAKIIKRDRDAPRSLPKGSTLKLYILSPNSRYSIFVGFLCLAIEGFLLLTRILKVPYTDSLSSTIFLVIALLLAILAFAFPVVNMHQVRHALESGISVIGKVDSVQSARTTPYSTAAGMSNGSINATVSYAIGDQEFQVPVFLDRPWVGSVKIGTFLRLLVDSDKHTIVYVVGIERQR